MGKKKLRSDWIGERIKCKKGDIWRKQIWSRKKIQVLKERRKATGNREG